MNGLSRLSAGLALLASFALALPAAADRRVGDPIDLGDFPITESGSFLSGRLALSLRDNDAAAKFLAEALQADPGNGDLLERTFNAFLSAGEIQRAQRYAERLVEIEPNHRFARLVLGVRALKAKQYAAARSQFERAGQRPLLDLVAAMLSTWAEVGRGRAADGVAAADALMGEPWYQLYKDFNAGMALDFAGNRAAAITRLRSAATLDANAIRIHEALARALAREGQREEAVRIIDSYLSRQPTNPLALDLKDDLARERRLSRMPGSIQQGAAESLVALAVPLSRQNGTDIALAFLQLAVYLDPANAIGQISLSDVYASIDQQQNAASALEAVPADSPLKRNAEIALGQTLDQLDRTEDGIKHLEAIIADNPKDYEALVALAGVLQGRKRFAEAADIYSKAIALITEPERQHWGVFYFRGITHERTKQWDKAEADFKKALELFPDQPDVLNYLGYSWIDMGMNLDEGMEMIRKAVEQKPNSAYIVDSLGWAYYRLGNYEKAVEHLERAIELKPSDAVMNDHLGDAYWKVGRKLEATFQWRHALDADPPPEEAEKAKIERKLVEGLQDTPTAAAAPAEPPKAGDGG